MNWTCNTCAVTNPAAQTGTLCSEWWRCWVRGHQLGHTHLETEAGSKSFGLVLGKATDGSGSRQLLLVSHPVQLGSPLLSKKGDPTLTPLTSLRIVHSNCTPLEWGRHFLECGSSEMVFILVVDGTKTLLGFGTGHYANCPQVKWLSARSLALRSRGSKGFEAFCLRAY